VRNLFINIFIAVFVSGFLFANSSLPKRYQHLIVVSNGKGKLLFRWILPPKYWSKKGWILKGGGVSKVVPLGRDMIRYLDMLNTSGSNKNAKQAMNLSILKMFLDFKKAQKDGFATILKVSKKGGVVYSLSVLGKNGVILKSDKIDAFKATKLPQAPYNLKAKNDKESIDLCWSPPKDKKFAPFAYKIYRKRVDGKWKKLTKPYLLTGVKWKKKKRLFSDPYAPLEKKVTYKVVGIDIFQRESKPSFVTIFHPDIKALTPPSDFKAEALKDGIKLSWKKSDNPLTLGYIIERGTWSEGFFSLITPKPLKRETTTYTDKSAKKEITYIYKIRSVNFRGEKGKASRLVNATIKDDTLVNTPKDLKAKVYPNMIKLSWKRADRDSIGVIVEKRYKGYDKWVVLNERPIEESFYDDFISYNSVGYVFYRIANIGKNGKRSSYSKTIKVKLPGRLPVYSPNLKSIDLKKNKVYMKFYLSEIGEKPDRILIHRGLMGDVKGKIIAILPADSTSYTDSKVISGKTYWYALSSEKTGMTKSKMGQKYLIKVDMQNLPVPEKPRLKYLKKPFEYIKVEFKKAPKNLGVTIYCKNDKDSFWVKKASNLKGTFFVDSDVPSKGTVSYKIVYNKPDLHEGKMSKISTINIR